MSYDEIYVVNMIENEVSKEDITTVILEFFGHYFEPDTTQKKLVETFTRTDNSLGLPDFVSDDVREELYKLSQDPKLTWSRGVGFRNLFERKPVIKRSGSVSGQVAANKFLWEVMILEPLFKQVRPDSKLSDWLGQPA